jgi:hypothetical protein
MRHDGEFEERSGTGENMKHAHSLLSQLRMTNKSKLATPNGESMVSHEDHMITSHDPPPGRATVRFHAQLQSEKSITHGQNPTNYKVLRPMVRRPDSGPFLEDHCIGFQICFPVKNVLTVCGYDYSSLFSLGRNSLIEA